MTQRLPRLLFRASWAFALGLVLLVLITPWLDLDGPGQGWRRVASLFARDSVVRRTSLACALGLVVTAHVFFQPECSSPTSCTPAEESPQSADGIAEAVPHAPPSPDAYRGWPTSGG